LTLPCDMTAVLQKIVTTEHEIRLKGQQLFGFLFVATGFRARPMRGIELYSNTVQLRKLGKD